METPPQLERDRQIKVMARKPKDLEPEDPEPNQTPGESLPAMEDTVRKLSGIFTENMRIPEGPAEVESDDDGSGDEDDE